MKIYHISALK